MWSKKKFYCQNLSYSSFQFAEEICEPHPTLYLGSLEITFYQHSSYKTIDICVNKQFENTNTVEGFTKSDFN